MISITLLTQMVLLQGKLAYISLTPECFITCDLCFQKLTHSGGTSSRTLSKERLNIGRPWVRAKQTISRIEINAQKKFIHLARPNCRLTIFFFIYWERNFLQQLMLFSRLRNKWKSNISIMPKSNHICHLSSLGVTQSYTKFCLVCIGLHISYLLNFSKCSLIQTACKKTQK